MRPAAVTFEGLIEALYDAAAGTIGWDAMLEALVGHFNGEVGAFSIVGPHLPGRILHTGIDPALIACYLERHAGRNELALRTASLPAGAVFNDTAVMLKAEFLQTAFYRDCLAPLGLQALLNCRAAMREDGLQANVCIFRTAAQGDFCEAEVALYRQLVPHLCRAVAVEIRMAEAEGERSVLTEALERLPCAAFVVDRAGILLRANASGGALLSKRDGLFADRAQGNTLRALQKEDTAALQQLLGKAANGAHGVTEHLCIYRPIPKRPLVVTVLPIGTHGDSRSGLPPSAAALLLATSPDLPSTSPPTGLLRDAFGLTRTEAEVAAHAASGEDVACIAAALGITQGTTRLHLHHVFEKVGVHRQTELAIVLGRLAP